MVNILQSLSKTVHLSLVLAILLFLGLFFGGGDFALNQTIQDLGPTITADDYLFLVTGAAHTGDSDHTAGKLLVTLYGHPTF